MGVALAVASIPPQEAQLNGKRCKGTLLNGNNSTGYTFWSYSLTRDNEVAALYSVLECHSVQVITLQNHLKQVPTVFRDHFMFCLVHSPNTQDKGEGHNTPPYFTAGLV